MQPIASSGSHRQHRRDVKERQQKTAAHEMLARFSGPLQVTENGSAKTVSQVLSQVSSHPRMMSRMSVTMTGNWRPSTTSHAGTMDLSEVWSVILAQTLRVGSRVSTQPSSELPFLASSKPVQHNPFSKSVPLYLYGFLVVLRHLRVDTSAPQRPKDTKGHKALQHAVRKFLGI